MPENTRATDARQPHDHRLYRGIQSHAIPVWNGIFEHRKKIGEALWEFLWCLDRITSERDAIGLVFGGAPVKIERIIADLGGDKESIRRHLKKLESGKYIRTRRTPYGQVIEVLNSRKFGVFQKPQSAGSLTGEKPTGEREKPIYESEKPQSAVSKEDFHSIDLSAKDERHTPAAATQPPDPRYQACYGLAYESFRTKYGSAPTWNGKDQKNLKALLKTHPEITVGEFSRRWCFYLASTEIFVVKQGYSLAFLCSRFDSFITGPQHNSGGQVYGSGNRSQRAGSTTAAAVRNVDRFSEMALSVQPSLPDRSN
jgi:hypothetical protein